MHTAFTKGPHAVLDDDSRGAIFPSRRTRLTSSGREQVSAIGAEGSRALAVYVLCAGVLLYGAALAVRTWNSGTRRIDIVPILGAGPQMNLTAFWFVFALAVGVCGWFLSGKVTKSWLRIFVVATIVVGAVLIITIGRNGRVADATSEAESEARRLLATAAAAQNAPEESAERALLEMLCTLGGIDASDCELSSTAVEAAQMEAAEMEAQAEAVPEGQGGSSTSSVGGGLDCLVGWTVETFAEWMDEASFDRQVAALTTLASCEIGAANPVAEEAAAEMLETQPVDGSAQPPDGTEDDGEDAEAGEEPQEADEAAEAGAPTPEARAAVREALQEQRSEILAHRAIATGADELLSFASGDTEFAEFRFSGAAWLVILAAVVLWYRRLEIRAGAHRLGPVDVRFEQPGGHPLDTDEAGAESRPPRTRAEAVFKESVIRNVPEPGAIPGGEALAPVGDLVAETDVPHKALISGVIEVASTIFATRGGFTVIFSIRSSDDGHVAFVRLRDTRTGTHLASHVVHDESEELAARSAGYWIAGWIISRSDYVPSWAQWSEEDVHGLVQMPLAWSAGVQPTARAPIAPDDFDPNAVNALILARRAYAHQISPRPEPAATTTPTPSGRRRNHLAALEDFARAVHREPRYPVARYRRGAVLATMMFRGGDLAAAAGLPADAPPATKRRLLPSPARLRYLFGDLLMGDRRRTAQQARADEAAVRGWVTAMLDEGRAFPDDMRLEMLRLVAEWSNRNHAAVRWGRLARLRPSERFFWKDFRRGRLERDWELLLKAELCMCAERLKHHLEETGRRPAPTGRRPSALDATQAERELAQIEAAVVERALEPDSHWQISYNLACLYAIRSARWSLRAERVGDWPALVAMQGAAACRAEAFQWLERCLDRPASDQLVREWVVADGDLRPLRHLGAFQVWSRRVRSASDSAEDRLEDPDRAATG
jgi:hypothetical protein